MLNADGPTLALSIALVLLAFSLMWGLFSQALRLSPGASMALASVNLLASLACPWAGSWPLEPLWAALALALLLNSGLAVGVLLRIVARLQRLTERDPLTDTLNRRAFDTALRTEHARLSRGHAYAVVMVDMDHFKRLNDTLGHAAGDAGLKALVTALGACMRTTDCLARVGGEEFALLLPDTDLAGAALVAERMRRKLVATPLQWHGKTWPLTASFGIAQARPEDPGPEATLERADRGLYRAKARGRNLVEALA